MQTVGQESFGDRCTAGFFEFASI